MIPNILVIGSTGKLGTKLLKFTYKNNIKIDSICCYKNKIKLFLQSKNFNFKNKFVLSKFIDEKRLFEYLKLKNKYCLFFRLWISINKISQSFFKLPIKINNRYC